MSDAVLTRDGPVGVPLDYKVPNGGELLPLTVRATIDGTSAASQFYAVVQVIAPSGRIMGSYITKGIAAGASADVTWFPGVTPEEQALPPSTFAGAQTFQAGDQNINDQTFTALSFAGTNFDNIGMFSLANPTRLTVTAGFAGYWRFYAHAAWVGHSDSGVRGVWIRLNGVTYFNAMEIPNANTPSEVDVLTSDILLLSVGDYVEAVVYQNSGATLQAEGNLAGSLVAGPTS